MKFTIAAGALADALSVAGRVIPKTPSLSVFSGAHLAVKAGKLSVTGSDELDTTVTVTLEVSDPAPGAAVLLPKPINAFLHTLPADTPVTVSSDDQTKVSVHARGGNPYTFRAMDATFPSTSTSKPDRRPVDFSRLAAAVASVKDCARKNKIVQLVSDETGLRLHATDNLRLARAVLPEAAFGSFSGLVPLPVLEQIAEAPVTEVHLDRNGRVLTAVGERITIVTRLIEELFPAVDTILQGTPPRQVDVPLPALKAALARLGSVAEDSRPLVVNIAGDQLVLSMDSVNVGSGAETIELDTPAASEVTFAVNLDFLEAAVAAHPTDVVTVAWTAPEQPIFLTSSEPIPVTNVIMPIRLT